MKVHGFTRETLARSVLHLPLTETRTNTHVEPLSDTAVSALFGEGDEARRTLINAWLQDGLRYMGTVQGVERPTIIVEDEKEEFDTAQSQYPQIDAAQQATSGIRASIKDVLHARLKYNEPALSYLPEVGRQFSNSNYDLRSATTGFCHSYLTIPWIPANSSSTSFEACSTSRRHSLFRNW